LGYEKTEAFNTYWTTIYFVAHSTQWVTTIYADHYTYRAATDFKAHYSAQQWLHKQENRHPSKGGAEGDATF